MSLELIRTHVMIPIDLLEEVDTLVGPRRRSAFLTAAAAEKVARLKLRHLLTSWEEPLSTRITPAGKRASLRLTGCATSGVSARSGSSRTIKAYDDLLPRYHRPH